MSENTKPEPSCSKEQLELHKSVYGKCIRSSRILNRNTNNSFCMHCFAHADVTTDSYGLIITHHLTNGLYEQYVCVGCHKRLCHVRPTLACSMCTREFTKLHTKYRDRGIDILKYNFRVDVLSPEAEGSTLSQPQHVP